MRWFLFIRWELTINNGLSAIDAMEHFPHFPREAKFSLLVSLGLAHLHMFDFENAAHYLKEAEKVVFFSVDIAPSPMDPLSASNAMSCPFSARLCAWMGIAMTLLGEKMEAIEYFNKVCVPLSSHLKSLAFNRSDIFVQSLLDKSLLSFHNSNSAHGTICK